MHIKQVVIEGFKSYKDQAITEPFSRSINVVVGANGSGKSNFFHAIRFVLNDAFVNMRAEERQQLLHEGAGHAVTSAYVEIVFDNSDGRFPLDRDEVRLRRTIGVKKDEYHLDKKHINKSEVTNLLESAGFSKANPYYIVQQGKITAMSQMKDEERMQLLKEIGGTRVYEERREESLKLMKETESRRAQIEEMVASLDAKLKELESERAEMIEYQATERTRRCLEFTLLDRDERAAREQLVQVEQQHKEESARSGAAHDGAHKAHSELAELAAQMRAAEAKRKATEASQVDVLTRRNEVVAKRAAADADVRELKDKVVRNTTMAGLAEKELATLDAEIAAQKEQLAAVVAELTAVEAEEATARRGQDDAEARQQQLRLKQGRKAQFASEAERDSSLKAEMKKVEGVVTQKQATLAATTAELRRRNEELMELAQAIGDKESELRGAEEVAAAAERQLAALKLKRDGAQDAKKDRWRQDNERDASAAVTQEELRRARQMLDNTIAWDIRRGLKDLEKVVRELGLGGQVHGQLLHLIECPPQMNLAVEVTAGNSLFNVVVDTDGVAARLIEELSRQKMGRVTFMPLNKLRAQSVTYPTQWGDGVMPLTKRLKFDPKFTPAIHQIFSKTVVCRDMDLALQVQRLGTLSAVTLEGDVAAKRGTTTGGWHDEGRARLETWRRIQDLEKQVADHQRDQQADAQETARLDGQVATLNGEVAKLDAGRNRGRDNVRVMKDDIRGLRKEDEALRGQVEKDEKACKALQEGVAAVQRQLDALRSELGTELASTLTAPEKAEMLALQPQLATLTDQLSKLAGRKNGIAANRASSDAKLRENLLPRRAQVVDALQGEQAATDTLALEGRTAELAELEGAVARLQAAAAEADAAAESAGRALRDFTARHTALREAEGSHEAQVSEEKAALEALAAKRVALKARGQDLRRKVAELGALPAEAYTKYKDKSAKELRRLLAEAAAALGKFGSVNRKALDQYTSFAEQRDEMARRIQDTTRSKDKIWELIKNLDMRKDEAIERTFKGVAQHFRAVFTELVPGGGRGELVMVKTRPDGLPGEEEEEDAPDAPRQGGKKRGIGGREEGSAEKYKGVKVKVAFTAGGETMSLKQLSGGQKTLVALALIFAIQRCDPAPFYLFDEIDAALDPQYRTTVAKMLMKQAHAPGALTQFIVTTFHPQIVNEADHVYGVAHKNRISNVYAITKGDAMQFLQVAQEPSQGGAAASDGGAAAGGSDGEAAAAGGSGGSRAAQDRHGADDGEQEDEDEEMADA